MKILESNLLEADVVELTLDDSSQGNKNWTVGDTAELLASQQDRIDEWNKNLDLNHPHLK